MTAKTNYTAKVKLPDPDGCMWRLMQKWDPNNIESWLRGELMLGTEMLITGAQVGRVLASATMFFAWRSTDVEAAARGKYGVFPAYEQSLDILMRQHGGEKTKGGLVVPPSLN